MKACSWMSVVTFMSCIVLFEVQKVETARASATLLQTYNILQAWFLYVFIMYVCIYIYICVCVFYSNYDLLEEDFTAGNCIPKILTDSNKANHSENPQKAKDPG